VSSGYLLDTSAVLIGLKEPGSLTEPARAAMLTGPNFLSVVVYWEVVLKSMKGGLEVGDPRDWWRDALEQLAATPLAMRPDHIAEVYRLPPIHQNLFDRVLIAQATVEDLILVTTDAKIPLYAGERFRTVV
jgi:PIN domain nuclease of toxin-antitoxin system